MTLNPAILMQLRDSLAILAAAPQDQAEYLRRTGVGVDELALELDDVAEAVVASGWLHDEAATAVRKVESRLTEMSGEANAQLWIGPALFGAPEWGEVRKLAAAALRQFPETPVSRRVVGIVEPRERCARSALAAGVS